MAQYNVTFDELDGLLKSLPENTIDTSYDICITEITKEQCKGNSTESGTLQYVLQQNDRKYISLSFLSLPDDLTNASMIFYKCNSLVSIDCSNFNNITDAYSMFGECYNLVSVKNANFSNLIDALEMFIFCESLKEVTNPNFINVTYAYNMFDICRSLVSIDTSTFVNVINAKQMFYECKSLTTIDTSAFTNVTNASYMFSGCTSLTTINKWGFDLSKLTGYEEHSEMLYGCPLSDIYCKSVELPNPYDGSLFPNVSQEATNVRNFINNTLGISGVTVHKGPLSYETPIKTPFIHLDTLLTQLPENTTETPYEVEITEITEEQCKGNPTAEEGTLQYVLHQNSTKYVGLSFTDFPSDLTYTNYMFWECTSLTTIDTSGFTNVTNAIQMFHGCISLTSIDTSGFINVTGAVSMFYSCTSLTSIDTSAFTNVTSASYMFWECPSLTSINKWGFDLSKLKDYREMFNDWYLSDIYCKDYIVPNPYDGSYFESYIYVDDFIKNKLELSRVTVHPNTVTLESPEYTPFVHFNSLLSHIPVNTFETPYNIEITDLTKENIKGGETAQKGTVQYALQNNPNKFITLNFTDIPDDATDKSYMFYNCKNLADVNIEKFSNTLNANYMFAGTNLKSLDIASMTFLTDANHMFDSCTWLDYIYNWNISKDCNTNGIIDNCRNELQIFIVPPEIKERTKTVQTGSGKFEEIYNFSLIRIRNAEGKRTLKIQSIGDTKSKSIEVSAGTNELVKFFNRSDELTYGKITNDQYSKMIQHLLPWGFSGKCLDPDAKNFVLWAADPDHVVSNITSGGGGGGKEEIKELSKVDYDELSEADKMNGLAYFVPDMEGTDICFIDDDKVQQETSWSSKKVKGELDKILADKYGVINLESTNDGLNIDTTGNSNGLIRKISNYEGNAVNVPSGFNWGFQKQFYFDANNSYVELTDISNKKKYVAHYVNKVWSGWVESANYSDITELLNNYIPKDYIYPPRNGGNANDIKGNFHEFVFNMQNTPPGYGFLDVSYFNGSGFLPSEGGVVKQLFTNWSTGQMFTRMYIANPGTWSSWQEFSTTPRQETIVGNIFNAANDPVMGLGQAIVTFQGGLARVDFEVYITIAGIVTDNFAVGLNRDLLKGLNNNIPVIVPTTGVCTFTDINGTVMGEEGYGGIARGVNQFWQFGRIYDPNGSVGGWPASQYKGNMRIKGTCYGTY